MAERSEYPFDVFISYAPADREWVDMWLVPELERAGLRISDDRDFIIGKPTLRNIEHAVESSHRTVVVLTPAWLESEWNELVELLAQASDPAARQRKLLPVLLEPCELPPHLDSLHKADLTDARHWEDQTLRLVRDIRDTIPVLPPWLEGKVRDFSQWKRWLRRYRRDIRRGVVAALVAWLVVFAVLQLPPFQPRQVWTSLGLRARNATQLVRLGDTLLVGGNNVETGCDHLERGLWRSGDNGLNWQPIHAPLCFERPGQGQVLADIVAFASSEARPERIYAATSDVGLLRSDDAGQNWQRGGNMGLSNPQLIAIAVDPTNADRVFVATQGGGLFRSEDGGGQWQRLDRQDGDLLCQQGQPLVGTLAVGAVLATPSHLIVGTSDPYDLTDIHVSSGLYASSDGGLCWRQVDDGRERDEYRALAYAATPEGEYVLMLVRDWWKEPGEKPMGIWRLDFAAPVPKRDLLWAQQQAIGSLMVQDETWYMATPFGRAMEATLQVPAHTETLPGLTRCLGLCDVAMAPNWDSGPPLLLAGQRVFRLEQGPWWRRVWP